MAKPFTGKFGSFDSNKTLGQFSDSSLGQMKENLPSGNPFATIEYSDDPEENARLELDEYMKVVSGQSDREKKYPKTMEGLVVSDIYLPVVFRDRDDKLAFFSEFGISITKVGDKYTDGEKLLAELLK